MRTPKITIDLRKIEHNTRIFTKCAVNIILRWLVLRKEPWGCLKLQRL